nr:uncharacterized protein LOC117682005 [Crassostrea gigas]XP_034304587.1 uncharacterized protein LOC117682005 [Crassostrea gigas]
MYLNSHCGFTLAIPLLWTLHLDKFTRAFPDKTENCTFNYYNDGSICKECPDGYYGTNCSHICPALFYGTKCLQTCDCLPCHHVYGCISTPHIAETTTSEYEIKDEIKKTTKIQESTNFKNENNDKVKCTNQTPEHKTNFGRNIIIYVGSVLSFMLIIEIIRELYLYCQCSGPTGRRAILDDIYTGIAEMENTRTV